MDIPFAIEAQASLTRQNIALSVIKATADQQQAMAKILEQSVRSAPINGVRGGYLNINA